MPRVLFFHYILTDNAGETIDSSRGSQPFPVMEGSKQIIPALEVHLFKMNAGDKKKVFLPAAEAYGPVNEKLRLVVKRAQLPDGDVQPGTRFKGGPEDYAPVFTVVKIEGDEVYLDGNHPLAGQDLHFDVEVMEVREATAEEIQHGHAHGAGGHHH